jgi:predicted DNA-binding protein (UPF0251 family)
MTQTAGDWDAEWWARQEAKRRAEEMQETLVRKQLDEIRTAHVEETVEAYVTQDEFNEFRECLYHGLKKDLATIKAELSKRLLWRGTWRSGEQYDVNDAVQDKGTVFIAVAPKAEGRPGTDAGWRQLVKTEVRA